MIKPDIFIWLNTDFQRTKSYSSKLSEVSVYYKTFSNIVTIRTIAAEYLIAMKLMSGRQYKNDLSDIAGILWEHQKINKPITLDTINKAITELYGNSTNIPDVARKFIEDVIHSGDYKQVYNEIRENERHSKDILLDFNKEYPEVLNESNMDSILEQARRKLNEDQ